MTNKEMRKRRLRQKRNRAMLLSVVSLIIIALAFYGILNLVKGKNNNNVNDSQSQQTQSESLQQGNSEDNSQDIILEPTPQPQILPQQTEFTTLVNKNNPLPTNFAVETRYIKGTEKLFDSRVAQNLEDMLSDASKAGYPMYLVSTYRTVAYQEGLYNRKIQEYINQGYTQELAKEEAGKWVAIPGTSEHNLGLAADIVSSTWYNTNNDLTGEFENTPHFTWLKDNCYKYGFIIRYPKGKESVTGISYEPWHYRYVGVELATYLTENSLTLEEYHEKF